MTAEAASFRRAIRWNILVGPVVILGNLALIAWALNTVGAVQYGVWLICFSVINIMMLADLGLGTATVKELALNGDDRETYARVCVTSAWLFAFLASTYALITPLGLNWYLTSRPGVDLSSETTTILGLASIGVFVAVISRYWVALHQGNYTFHYERVYTLGGLVVRTVALALCSTIGFDSPLTVVALSEVVALAGVGIGCAISAILSGWTARPTRLEGLATARRLLSVGLPAFTSSFSTLAAMQVPMLVSGVRVSGQEAAGVAALTRVYVAGRTAYGWACSPLLPAASGGSQPHIARSFATSSAVAGRIGLLVSAPIVAAPQISELWLGAAFSPSIIPVVVCIALAMLSHARFAPAAVLLVGVGQPYRLVMPVLIWLALVTTASYVFIRDDLWVVGACIGFPAVLVLEFIVLRTYYQFGYSWWRPTLHTWGLLILVGAGGSVCRLLVENDWAKLALPLLFCTLTLATTFAYDRRRLHYRQFAFEKEIR